MSTKAASYVTIEAAAQHVRMSESTLRRLARDGKVPVCQPGGPRHKLLFSLDALDAWMLAETWTAQPIEQLGRAPKRRDGKPKPSQRLLNERCARVEVR